MGCDIHAWVEWKDGDRWRSYGSEMYLDRDYELFSKLAGVRGKSTPLVKPRGMPQDLGWRCEEDTDKDRNDLHSPTWLTCDEFIKVLVHHLDMQEDRQYYAQYLVVAASMKMFEECGFPSRVILAFDN